MRLNITQTANIQMKNWEVYDRSYYNGDTTTSVEDWKLDWYLYLLRAKKEWKDTIGVAINRNPTPLTTKIEVCFNVKILKGTMDNVIYTEDVSLSTLKDGIGFWGRVNNYLNDNV